MTDKQLDKLIENYADRLAEHCDSVVILVTYPSHRRRDDDRGVPLGSHVRRGNCFAQKASIKALLGYVGARRLSLWIRLRRLFKLRGTRLTICERGNVYANQGIAEEWLIDMDQKVDSVATDDEDDGESEKDAKS